jgi:hypothetical protein
MGKYSKKLHFVARYLKQRQLSTDKWLPKNVIWSTICLPKTATNLLRMMCSRASTGITFASTRDSSLQQLKPWRTSSSHVASKLKTGKPKSLWSCFSRENAGSRGFLMCEAWFGTSISSTYLLRRCLERKVASWSGFRDRICLSLAARTLTTLNLTLTPLCKRNTCTTWLGGRPKAQWRKS